jgi:UDP:flavonoid glycosyltransferase YjiC (YdhE family)
MASSGNNLPLLLFVAAAAEGHIGPPLQIASHLIQAGYEVLFLNSPEFKEQITRAGAEWAYLEPLDLSEFTPEHFAAAQIKLPAQRIAYGFEKAFLTGLPKRAQQLREALESIRRYNPAREVIILHEVASFAVHPFVGYHHEYAAFVWCIQYESLGSC